MGGIFSAPKPPAPPPPPPPPEPTDTEVKSAARDDRMRRAKMQGRASTILTSNQGTTDTATTAGARLLGQ